jgi:hypothetical protein
MTSACRKFDGEFHNPRDVVLHRPIGMSVRHVGIQLACEFESGLVLDVDDHAARPFRNEPTHDSLPDRRWRHR